VQEARAALTTLGYAFGVALIAWILYGMMGGGAASGGSFWTTFIIEMLASVAIGGMAALPIALFPVRGLPGSTIWKWNRWIWAGCYAVGLIAFFIVLMPMPFSWAGVSLDLSAWIGIYLAYLVAAVVLWLLIARPWNRSKTVPAEASEQVDPPADEAKDPVAATADDAEGPMR
jgi:hypothetical protein